MTGVWGDTQLLQGLTGLAEETIIIIIIIIIMIIGFYDAFKEFSLCLQ